MLDTVPDPFHGLNLESSDEYMACLKRTWSCVTDPCSTS